MFYEKLAEAVRLYPCLYNKSSEDFKDANKKKLCWKDVAAAVGVSSGKWTFYSFVMDLELWSINSANYGNYGKCSLASRSSFSSLFLSIYDVVVFCVAAEERGELPLRTPFWKCRSYHSPLSFFWRKLRLCMSPLLCLCNMCKLLYAYVYAYAYAYVTV